MVKIKEECTGCMACRNICPAGAIGTKRNENGFLMPVVDSSRCMHCGQCEEACPLEGKDSGRPDPKKAYAMYHLSEHVVSISSSGGAFYALASEVLKQGGIVFGCYLDVKKKMAYLADTDHMPLEKLLTSKYVESYIGDGYQKVKRHLEAGRKVLFCGTPCQAAGLSGFLGKDDENLLLVDFACGAVTSQTFLRDYLRGLERRFQSKVQEVNFRDKHYGWGQYCFWAKFENGRVYRKTAMSDPYFFCFLRSSMQRFSCHGCRFAERHYSDVVLSDFWKCGHFLVEGNGRRGLSLALAMTQKGQEALESIRGQAHMEELDRAEASYHLKARSCPKDKAPEIYAHQACAAQHGVSVLRKQLLTPRKRLYYAVRQFVMDRPKLAAHFPKLVGRGQLM